MTDHKEHTRRIAKNTLMLYVRMFFMMVLGLFTSRIVLEALGEEDFGIYNVVGGVVAMFTVISGALTSAISRFITFETGRVEGRRLNVVFSTAVIVQVVLSAIVVVLAEPLGLWFIENRMNVGPEMIPAAKWVLHFSIFTFVVNLMSVPQMALITAHEKMSAYAVIDIVYGLLRFGTAVAIACSSSDRLVLYAALMALSVLVVRILYSLYCRRNFPESRFRPIFEFPLLKEMFSFAGWNFIGVASSVLRDQGGNILINIFYGPVANAARGVALQLNGVVQGFVTNFMTAVNPQITKSYAAGDFSYSFSLVRKASRMSYYLLYVLILPVLFNMEYLMELWLKEVPDHAVLFAQLFLVFTLSESVSTPLMTLMLATGRIRNYQIVVGGIQLLNLPISYLLLKAGMQPEIIVAVAIVISQLCFFARLVMLNKATGLRISVFFRHVYLNILLVIIVSLCIPLLLNSCPGHGFVHFVLKAAICFASAVLSVLFVGCSRQERTEVMSYIVKKFRHDKD